MSLGWMDILEADLANVHGLEKGIHDLEENLRVMQVGRWWKKVRSEEEWRRIVREAKAHPGL
jgi:hypothetical protein